MSIRSRGRNLLYLSEVARDTIVEAAAASHPIETGGILLGVEALKRPWVVAAIEVDTNARTAHSFLIPRGTTGTEIDDARRADPRLGYVGDWHIHPADQGASRTDFTTLRRVGIEVGGEVVTLVARRMGNSSYKIEAWLCKRRRIRQAQVVLTGPL